jgi:hypothetical protein
VSLCPNYCECGSCKHGRKLCEDCRECANEYSRESAQTAHEQSVARQKNKLRPIARVPR